MPIYEYQCQHCGKQLEEMQKVSDPELKKCPSCGKDTLKRIVSHTSFQLKGGGYYATDYKKPAAAPEKDTTEKNPATPPKPEQKTDK